MKKEGWILIDLPKELCCNRFIDFQNYNLNLHEDKTVYMYMFLKQTMTPENGILWTLVTSMLLCKSQAS